MKKLLIILFFLIPLLVSGGTYYVATTGADGAAGTFAAPWATWQKGFSTIIAGDTLYIRGGTYQPTGTSAGTPFGTEWWGGVALVAKAGTAINRIVVLNYANEVPILDGVNLTAAQGSVGSRFAIIMRNCDYWTIKGLTITGVAQLPGELGVNGIRFSEGSDHNVLERVVSHDNGGSGICFVYDCTDNLIYNCDSYDNVDPISASPYDNSDGIEIAEISSTAMTNTVRGCRMWGNCDDGMDLFDNEGIVVIDSCWSFNNSKPVAPSDANGFKLGRTNNTHGTYRRVITNCLAFDNQLSGISTGGDAYCDMTIYNCVAVNNTYGFMFYLTTSADCGEIIVRNNAAYGNTDNFRHKYAPMIIDHNSYDSDFELTGPPAAESDYVSVDTTGVTGARQSGGSLPNINFLKLDSGSGLIDVGVDVGISFNGTAPDLGAFEYGTTTPVSENDNFIIRGTNIMIDKNGNIIVIR